jgi:hypothetical protein
MAIKSSRSDIIATAAFHGMMDRLSSPKRTDPRVGRAEHDDGSYVANSEGTGECRLTVSPKNFAEYKVRFPVVLRPTKTRR